MSKRSFRGVHRAVEELLQSGRPNADAFFGVEHLTPAAATVLRDAFDSVPEICRWPLATQATRMHGRVCAFLQTLGRPADESGMEITGVRLEALGAETPYHCGVGFALSGADIRSLADAAVVTYAADRFTPERLFQYLDDADLPPEAQRDAQHVAISGPVHVIFSPDFRPQPPAPLPITAVSIAGINFAYSPVDRDAFTREATPESDDDGASSSPVIRRLVVNEAPAVLRMMEILHHAFLAFQRANVTYPCLNAIGCGAFKGPFNRVPHLWARAACELLQRHSYGFAAVLYSLPTFGDDHFTVFRRVFAAGSGLRSCVVLVEDKGMIAFADHFARHGHRAGILNPSDAVAVRQGYIGMYWDGGHVALEELLAMQTTLLLQHKGVNPALYRDPTRWVPLTLDVDGPATTLADSRSPAPSTHLKCNL